VKIIDDRQQTLDVFTPSGDTVTPEGLAEEAKAEWDHKGEALISLFSIFVL
jgi:hypothetical protein